MIVRRREFLRLLGVAAGSAGVAGCNPEWSVPDRLVRLALRGPGLETEQQTICGLCQGGCGLSVRLVDGLPVGLKGNPRHPLNRGGLCPVGLGSLEALYSPDRLRTPLRRLPDGGFEPVAWERALGEIAEPLMRLRKAGQGDRIALLSGESEGLFDDLARRLMSFLGSQNIYSLGQAESLPFALTQGGSNPPRFDLARTDLLVSFGLDVFEDGPAPVHAMSALIGTRETGSRCGLVQVGTRLSPSACKAEIFVPVRPGTHGAFALGVAHVLVRENHYDAEFVRRRTFGFEDWRDGTRDRLGFRRLVVERYYPDRVAQICGCEASSVLRVARRVAAAAAPLALAGGEAVEGSNATWTAMAVHAVNALTGAFDRPGGLFAASPIPFSPLPQAAESAAEAPSPIFGSQGGAAGGPGDAVEALAEGVLDGSRPIEVLLLAGCDPVAESPAGERLREALRKIPTTVALVPFLDQTAEACGFVLATHLFLEDWRASTAPAWSSINALGLTKPVIEPLHETRSPGDALLELGRQVDPEAAQRWFPWPSYADYLKARIEGLLVSGQGSVISGSFEESWKRFLEERGWRFLERGTVEDLWNELQKQGGWWDPVLPRGDESALFPTPSGRFEFFSRTLQRRYSELGAEAGPEESALERGVQVLGLSVEEADEACLPHHEEPRMDGEGDLVLAPFRPITARGREGVHSPMVLEMFGSTELLGWETWAELSPETAAEQGVEEGDRVALESKRGRIQAVVRVKPGGAPHTVHVPLGLGRHAASGASRSVGSNPVAILQPIRDSLSGALSLQATLVRLKLIQRRRRGGPAPSWRGEET